jgi:hypothetical protein
MKLHIMKVFFIFLFPLPLLGTLFPGNLCLSSDLDREAKFHSHVKKKVKLVIFYSVILYTGDGKTKGSYLTGTEARIAHSV